MPPTTLRVITGGQPARPAAERARAEARLQADRWAIQSGRGGSEAVTAPLAAVAAGG